MLYFLRCTVWLCIALFSGVSLASNYQIDTKDTHAFIQFRIQHLGYSWLWGRFNRFEGSFSYDPRRPEAARAEVVVDMKSIDTNHAERDKHLRSEDYLDVERYPRARFVAQGYQPTGKGKGELKGELTLHGQTRPLVLTVTKVGEGPDPWGGYRAGFEARARLRLKDFGMDFNLGSAAETMELIISVEGVREERCPRGGNPKRPGC